jgi:hypothetical protein
MGPNTTGEPPEPDTTGEPPEPDTTGEPSEPDVIDRDRADTGGSDPREVDPEAVRQAIRDRAGEIRRREHSRAIDRLEARGELSARQRQVLAETAAAIVDGILAGPESTLAEASDADCETVETAATLFDPDETG